MHPLISEGISLFLRFAHLIAGIMWIGSSIFFHWMDSHLDRLNDEEKLKRPGLEGVLWMVHSGGFYEVEKKLVAPGGLPKHLHWFKWEAAFTWITGFMLLILVYHLGGGALMVDASHAHISPTTASALTIGTMVVAWFAYDTLWMSKLGGKASDNPPLTVGLSIAGLAGIAFLFTHFLSGRAAYIHVAAVMGTCMVANVWRRIIPAQQDLVASVKAGTPPDASKAYNAKRRSKHNHYMTYPVVFIMISNHFPSTYGSSLNWALLLGLMGLGAVAKWWMNKTDPEATVLLAILGAVVVVGAGSTVINTMQHNAEEQAAASAAPTTTAAAVKSVPRGSITGVVHWQGAVPAPKEVQLYGGCEVGTTGGKASFPEVVVNDTGAVAEAFVWIKSGIDGSAVPAAPTTEVIVDQKSCQYAPRVVGARVNQPVAFLNSDSFFHNVRSVAQQNETWSLNFPAAGSKEVKRFKKAEIMVETRCDVHPWMVAHVGVVDHPWFAVTGADGTFSWGDVPAGDVVVAAWVNGRVVEKPVHVDASDSVNLDLVFAP